MGRAGGGAGRLALGPAAPVPTLLHHPIAGTALPPAGLAPKPPRLGQQLSCTFQDARAEELGCTVCPDSRTPPHSIPSQSARPQRMQIIHPPFPSLSQAGASSVALLLLYPRTCLFPPLPSPLPESPFPTADSPIRQPPLTSKDLEDSGNVEPPALGEREQLAKEQEQGQDAEDDGEDHHRLDRLQPFWGKTDRRKPQCGHHR